ncbi:Uncharacterized protein FKW44_006844 [Caligus rogercresseyi]|uniref:DUF7041 domain-containing protein n=1 Tax=Caligus rogercresseyi TaxID=217165 RepID=A0A7T8QT67_CALRO|nr:Uncharacterized protein FKW44_006844 [Caligus rogercresseyi]
MLSNQNIVTNSEVSLQAVSLKLPGFWPQQASIWFCQAESQFKMKGIKSEDTKYHHVVASSTKLRPFA